MSPVYAFGPDKKKSLAFYSRFLLETAHVIKDSFIANEANLILTFDGR